MLNPVFVSSVNAEVAKAIISDFRNLPLLNEIRHTLKNNGKPCELYHVFRFIVSDIYGISAKTVVYADAFPYMLKVRKCLFNPSDYGMNGKYTEICKRIDLYTLNGQKKTTWSEFSAHKVGKKDITDKVEKEHTESKTGAGDWLVSKRSSTLEQFRKEFSAKENTYIEWEVKKTVVRKAGKRTPERTVEIDIYWRKTFKEFFDTLEEFGSLDTWFKSEIPWTENGYLLRLQEFQTSDKKIRFLMEHNDK